MGHFDRKNYIITVFLKESCSDRRILEWQLEKDYTYTAKEVDKFFASLGQLYNPLAEKIVRFFIEYKDGCLRPDRWNTFEPIKHKYIASDFYNYVSYVSSPSQHLYFRKLRKYDCHIQNCDYGFWWFDNKPCRPTLSFEHLVEMRIYFSKQTNPSMTFMQEITDDMAKYFNTDYARIIDQEIASELPPLYEKDPGAIIYDIINKEGGVGSYFRK